MFVDIMEPSRRPAHTRGRPVRIVSTQTTIIHRTRGQKVESVRGAAPLGDCCKFYLASCVACLVATELIRRREVRGIGYSRYSYVSTCVGNRYRAAAPPLTRLFAPTSIAESFVLPRRVDWTHGEVDLPCTQFNAY